MREKKEVSMFANLSKIPMAKQLADAL